MSNARTASVEPGGPPPSGQLDALVEVLDQVRDGRARTRPEIMSRTGLSRAVVTQRVSDLVSRGLLEEAEFGPSTGGRAPRILRFRADSGFVLAADLGATHATVAAADLAGRLLMHREEPSDIAAGPHAVLAHVQRLFDEMLASADNRLQGRLWGIGIGVPGPVEFDSGCPVAPPIMPGWDRYPVRTALAARYDVPVWVDNDVNVMALGEVRAGIARDHELVVFVKIGTGIGAGIVERGRILRGAQGAAGDVGHIQITADETVVCRCGKIGCLEALAGGGAIARLAECAARDGRSAVLAGMLGRAGSLSAADVAVAATHGDPVALELFTEAGRLLGQMLATVVNLLNPSLIVIGGGVATAGDSLLASIRHTVYGRSLPLATRDLVIQRGALGHTGGVIGAASMVVDELFSRERLPLWLEAGSPAGRPDLAAA
jgi:glucokinase-like ROK family protein